MELTCWNYPGFAQTPKKPSRLRGGTCEHQLLTDCPGPGAGNAGQRQKQQGKLRFAIAA